MKGWINMNGKTLKVVEYNLTFGDSNRLVDVFGCFKYLNNNKLYVIYSDHQNNYNIVYYGSSYIKNNSILCMECNDARDIEIIKEYIFKITKNEPLENFEIIKLDTIEGIEIIKSNRLEIKPEVINDLTQKTIPIEKKEVKTVIQKQNKKSPIGKILIVIILAAAIWYGFTYITNNSNQNNITKSITCVKTYPAENINATIVETRKLNFNHNEILQNINTSKVYKFTENDYLDFINKGLLYQYMPDNNNGGWDKDDTEHTFSIYIKEDVKNDTSYKDPKDYEGALINIKNNGFSCEENIEGE